MIHDFEQRGLAALAHGSNMPLTVEPVLTAARAQELGWQVEAVAAQKEEDFADQVAALGINPINSQAIVHAVKEANDAHIPVFMQSLITPSAPLQ